MFCDRAEFEDQVCILFLSLNFCCSIDLVVAEIVIDLQLKENVLRFFKCWFFQV